LSQNPKADCLAKMLDEQISSFRTRRLRNKRMAFTLQMAGTLLSALTTVLLGVQFKEHPIDHFYMRNFALGFSAAVTVFSAWESFFDHKGLWVRFAKTHSQLLAIKAELDYLLSGGGPVDDKNLDLLFTQYQTVLAESNNSWVQLRSQNTSTKS
jgi:hypothetical protein